LASRHTWESRIWGNTFVQLDAIALGVILAVLLAGTAPRIARLPRIALFTGGLACLVLAGNYFQIKADPLTVSRVLLGYPVMAIGAVALFLATLRDQPPTDVSNDNKAGGPHPPGARGRSAVSWRVPGGEASFGECGAEAVTGGPYSPSVGECGIEASAYSRKTSAALPHQPVCSEHEDASAVATLAVPSQPERRRMPLPQSRRWQVSQLFVYLGRISYGLYVFHVLGLMISDFAVPHQGASLGRFLYRDTVGFAITVALSAISYRWLETPFLNLKQRFTHVLSRPGG
jgi:peptidoglycan/LPS O-acetylase OafA/YrhL